MGTRPLLPSTLRLGGVGKAYNIHLFFGKDVPHLHLQGRGGFGKLPWCFDRGSRQVVFPPMFNKQHYDVVLLEFSVFFWVI